MGLHGLGRGRAGKESGRKRDLEEEMHEEGG